MKKKLLRDGGSQLIKYIYIELYVKALIKFTKHIIIL